MQKVYTAKFQSVQENVEYKNFDEVIQVSVECQVGPKPGPFIVNIPLSCACTQVMRRAHTNFSSKDAFAHIYFTSFHIQMNSGQMLHKRNFMCTQTLKN